LRKTFQEESSGEACVVDQLSCYLTGETTQPWIGSHRVAKSAGFGQRRCDMLRSTPHIRPSWKHENEAVDRLSMELENGFCMMLIRDKDSERFDGKAGPGLSSIAKHHRRLLHSRSLSSNQIIRKFSSIVSIMTALAYYTGLLQSPASRMPTPKLHQLQP
jgi:hypothetical protein